MFHTSDGTIPFRTGDLVQYTPLSARMWGGEELGPVLGTVIAVYVIPVRAGRGSQRGAPNPQAPGARGPQRAHLAGPYIDIMFNGPIPTGTLSREHQSPHGSRKRHPMDTGLKRLSETAGPAFYQTTCRFAYRIYHTSSHIQRVK
jgi:hypothetical protein